MRRSSSSANSTCNGDCQKFLRTSAGMRHKMLPSIILSQHPLITICVCLSACLCKFGCVFVTICVSIFCLFDVALYVCLLLYVCLCFHMPSFLCLCRYAHLFLGDVSLGKARLGINYCIVHFDMWSFFSWQINSK